MRKFYTKSLFTALLLLCSIVATAHDFYTGGIYYDITNSTTKTVRVTCKGDYYNAYDNEYSGAVTIPATVTYNGTTYSVTSIAYRAFYKCAGLTSVTIGSSVTTIEYWAFDDCTGLKSVTIGNSVTTIEEHAFRGCTNLTSIKTPNSVKTIGYKAFYNCTSLKSVTIGNSVTTIDGEAFLNCSRLSTVFNFSKLIFSKGSSSFGHIAYYADNVINAPNGSIEGDFVWSVIDGSNTLCGYIGYDGNVTFPENYNGEKYSIGSKAFYDCKDLTSITMPNSVTSIGEYAFSNCTSLTSITIPNSVTSIGMCAFSSCTGLTSVIIGNSVTTIGSYAFDDCENLTSIRIGNSVTSIGYRAFYVCTGLTSITIPNSVTSIEYNAFYGCTGLKTVYNFSKLIFSKGSSSFGHIAYYADNVINAPNGSIEGDFVWSVIDGSNTLCGYVGNNSEITLPSNYKGENYAIGDEVFRDCTSLSSITISNSVTTIGNKAFYNCTNLTDLHISDLSAWCNIYFEDEYANPLYYAKNLYLNDEKVTDLIIPNNITKIKDYAFYNCTNLTSVTIPNSVTTIGKKAFSSSGLTRITIPNSVTSIGESAFNYCTRLTSITIPNSVTSIGSSAFYSCTGLTSITIGSSVTSIGKYAFSGCKNILEIKNKSNIARTSNENIFSTDTYNNAFLYVPKGRKFVYEKTIPWNKFYIVETEFTDESENDTAVGDIDGDGSIDIADVTALVKTILDDAESNTSAADVDGDGSIDIADVTALVKTILDGAE